MAAAPLIGNAVQSYGQLEAGKLTSKSLNLQADNLEAQADESEQKGQFDAMRSQVMAEQRIGTSAAAYGASGVSSNSGSVLAVMEASHKNAELDRLNILHGADIRAINYRNQASMNRFGGASALMGSYFAALGSLTSGSVASFGNAQAAKPIGGGGEAAASETGAGTEAGSGEGAGLAAAGSIA